MLIWLGKSAFLSVSARHLASGGRNLTIEQVWMQKIQKSEKKDEIFITRKLEKCQSEERKVTSRFLGENLSQTRKFDLKISRSLSPVSLPRAILSLPSSRQHSLSSPFSTSSCSLSSSHSPRQGRRHSLLRSLDTIFGFGQAVPPASSSRPSSPFQLTFLGQIYRQSLEQRAPLQKQKSSNIEAWENFCQAQFQLVIAIAIQLS